MVRKKSASATIQGRNQERIKRRALVAMFSDDDFMQRLALKGGNALGLIHKVTDRASFDIDLSMEGDFDREHLDKVADSLKHRLTQSFRDADYFLFDFHFEERPPSLTDDLRDFWGGYKIDFKIIERVKYKQHRDDFEALRRNAVPLGPRSSTKQFVDISKHEHCRGKTAVEVDGYTVYVYTHQMIVCEKLRAICQQRPSYAEAVMTHRVPRARDFFDIHQVIQKLGFDVRDYSTHEMLDAIFDAKRVPYKLLGEIEEDREFHRSDWTSVEATVESHIKLKSFDYYFDYVIKLVQNLQAVRKE